MSLVLGWCIPVSSFCICPPGSEFQAYISAYSKIASRLRYKGNYKVQLLRGFALDTVDIAYSCTSARFSCMAVNL